MAVMPGCGLPCDVVGGMCNLMVSRGTGRKQDAVQVRGGEAGRVQARFRPSKARAWTGVATARL